VKNCEDLVGYDVPVSLGLPELPLVGQSAKISLWNFTKFIDSKIKLQNVKIISLFQTFKIKSKNDF